MDVRVFRLAVERIGEGTAVWSPDLLELNLFSYDRERPLRDLERVLRDILTEKLGRAVAVGIVPAGLTEPVAAPRHLEPGESHLIVATPEPHAEPGPAAAELAR